MQSLYTLSNLYIFSFTCKYYNRANYNLAQTYVPRVHMRAIKLPSLLLIYWTDFSRWSPTRSTVLYVIQHMKGVIRHIGLVHSSEFGFRPILNIGRKVERVIRWDRPEGGAGHVCIFIHVELNHQFCHGEPSAIASR